MAEERKDIIERTKGEPKGKPRKLLTLEQIQALRSLIRDPNVSDELKERLQARIDEEVQDKQFPSEEPPEKKTEVIDLREKSTGGKIHRGRPASSSQEKTG